ncbi:hypothetical protein GN958_ATG05728 [Phytophthora infestans]|uniref:Secreted peptide n=1 Tax=Phytophthora infestans TaxID=4787 RepID=A0A8S9UWI1_PHYIN|nr:hypothetical protein GN958_ATG05728 [Phytophthora infestans]
MPATRVSSRVTVVIILFSVAMSAASLSPLLAASVAGACCGASPASVVASVVLPVVVRASGAVRVVSVRLGVRPDRVVIPPVTTVRRVFTIGSSNLVTAPNCNP